jgi:hypothetical protein
MKRIVQESEYRKAATHCYPYLTCSYSSFLARKVFKWVNQTISQDNLLIRLKLLC